MRPIALLLVVVSLAAACLADERGDVAYLKRLLEDLRSARAEALATGDSEEASRLLREIENVEYILARLITESVPPEPWSSSPTNPGAERGPRRDARSSITLEQAFEGKLDDLLDLLADGTGMLLVRDAAKYDDMVRVSPGSYDALALAKAVLIQSKHAFELVEPGPILVVIDP